MADALMQERGHSSLSSLVEELIRNKYEELTGPIRAEPKRGKSSGLTYPPGRAEAALIEDKPAKKPKAA